MAIDVSNESLCLDVDFDGRVDEDDLPVWTIPRIPRA